MRYVYFVFVTGVVILLLSLRFTHSYFSDAAVSGVNTFAAAQAFPTVAVAITDAPTPTVTPTSMITPTITSSPVATTGAIVINEVYYDAATDKGSEGNTQNPDEWVELYNASNVAINIKDWAFGDTSGTDGISNANLIVPAGGYLLIAKNNSTWNSWTEDPNAMKHPLGDKIGDGLANTGDTLILKDAAGKTIDQVSWGDDTIAFTPSVVDVADGHSIERDPDGVDTNTAADFVDRTNPTPGS